MGCEQGRRGGPPLYVQSLSDQAPVGLSPLKKMLRLARLLGVLSLARALSPFRAWCASAGVLAPSVEHAECGGVPGVLPIRQLPAARLKNAQVLREKQRRL